MSTNEVINKIVELYMDIVESDYEKENYPMEIEDVVDKLGECLELLGNKNNGK